ncbi:hypothetical protein D3C81_1692080 [compost metagenome]
MPVKTICPNTGAVIYSRTPEEQRLVDMEKEIAELKKLVSKVGEKDEAKSNK